MADEPANIVIEHLRHMRRVIDGLAADMSDVKTRITTLEIGNGQIISQIGHLHTQIAGQALRLDRVDERLGRIERRLDLVETP